VVRGVEEREPVGTTLPVPGMVGSSQAMIRVAEAIRKHASLRAPVLIVGESGVGKDVAARAIHTLSGRQGDYLPINMSTIPESLADSELFGHTRGAFTGAQSNRCGAFASANKGTILLDEIGELPLAIQAKLLRVVEDGVVRPVGASRVQTVDVRLVSATWVPLVERVLEGKFRFDLLQRLSTVVIEIPPLRKRKVDIPALVANWLQRHESEFGTRVLTSAAMARLAAHRWPGNVRELASVLYRACVSTDSVEVDWQSIDGGLRAGIAEPARDFNDPREVLKRCHGNMSLAARAAGVARSTFRSRLARSCGFE
jgi:DNA-binding NtrC family response regulator